MAPPSGFDRSQVTDARQGRGGSFQQAPPYDEQDEEEENDEIGHLPSSNNAGGPSSSHFGTRAKSHAALQNKLRNLHMDDWSPLTAEGCFAQALEVDVVEDKEQEKATFRVYYTPPITLAQRRREKAGRAPLSAFAKSAPPSHTGVGASEDSLMDLQPPSIEDDEQDNSSTAPTSADENNDDDDEAGTVFVLLHGAGFSALSWALMAKEVTKATKGEAGVLAIDCRGHGRTRHPEHSLPLDMTLERLTRDAIAVLKSIFVSPTDAETVQKKPMPHLVLVGHSMGGSVAVSLAHALLPPSSGNPAPIPGIKLTGVAVLDVVEGTAMEALPGMKTIVEAQPKGFKSVEEAIRWHVEGNTIQNRESARRSVLPLVVPNPNYEPAAKGENGIERDNEDEEETMEEMQDDNDGVHPDSKQSTSATQHAYLWRADLLSSAPYWSGWFESLSSRFLSVRCARLLLLAGTDRLDKDLMIGQMQGKYQLVVYQDVGHCLQEDAPARTAQTLIDFWRRNETLKVKRIVPGSGTQQDVRLHRVGQ